MLYIFVYCTYTTIVGKWELTELETEGSLEGDTGLVMSVSQLPLHNLDTKHVCVMYVVSLVSYFYIQQAAKHYAIAAKLDRPFIFQGTETFVVQ